MPRNELLHILARTAFDHLPDWPVADLQEPVICEKTDQELCRHIQDRHRFRRPDRRSHGHEIMVHELVAVPVLREVGTERYRLAESVAIRQGGFVEAQNVANHPIERRTQDVPALREQGVQ